VKSSTNASSPAHAADQRRRTIRHTPAIAARVPLTEALSLSGKRDLPPVVQGDGHHSQNIVIVSNDFFLPESDKPAVWPVIGRFARYP
jgi:hypothetical protein